MDEYITFNGHLFKKTKYEGYYVSQYGEIISIKIKGGQGKLDINNPRYHATKIDKDGYIEVCLSSINEFSEHIRLYRRLHRLIWETFNGDIPDNLTIDHIDGNPQNNQLFNLRLLTREENTSIAILNKPSSKRYIYALFENNIFCGFYDRNELNYIFNLNTNKIWYKDYITFFKNMGFEIEFIGSVEDIEKIAYC